MLNMFQMLPLAASVFGSPNLVEENKVPTLREGELIGNIPLLQGKINTFYCLFHGIFRGHFYRNNQFIGVIHLYTWTFERMRIQMVPFIGRKSIHLDGATRLDAMLGKSDRTIVSLKWW